MRWESKGRVEMDGLGLFEISYVFRRRKVSQGWWILIQCHDILVMTVNMPN